jgi:Na+/H+-dicarboxylate symporter
MKSIPSLIPLPLYTQVLIAVLCGGLLGTVFGQEPYLGGLRNEHLGKLGLFVVTLLKTLAVPLIFFAILDALIRTTIPLRQGGRLLVICLVNVSVAMTIGLAIMNTWQPGLAWYGHVDELLHLVPGTKPSAAALANVQAGSQSPLEYLASYIPRTLTDPFSSNNIIGVVLLALVLGATLRLVRSDTNQTSGAVNVLVRAIDRIYVRLVQLLGWIILVVPLAVFGVVAQVVGKAGIGVFSVLWIFLVAMLSGLALHALVYYSLLAWLVGKKSPKVYLGQGADAILTAVSCNSSLATVPVTLQCLHRMNVSPQSSRLAACVGTNLNNDGITLYEAMAALFLAQALGFDLPMAKQVLIVLASIIAGAGVAGIPEAGLIVLPLVLAAAGLPNQVIIAAIPLIMTVDWIIARARSGVNVMSDMLVAILLDVGQDTPASLPAARSRR